MSFNLFLGCATLLATHSVFAMEQKDTAAKVIMARGVATAIDPLSNRRSLSRRSIIYVGETLETQNSSTIQLRFTDNAVMTLRENTVFKIGEYVAGDSQKGGSAIMELVSGGFRTVTGKIGKGNKDKYQVKTTAGSIGIRGTFYDAVTNLSNSLFVAVWDGAIEINNNSGSLSLGDGHDFQFGKIEQNSAPIGLKEPAPEISAPPPQQNVSSSEESKSSEDSDNQDETSEQTDDEKSNDTNDTNNTSDTDSNETQDQNNIKIDDNSFELDSLIETEIQESIENIQEINVENEISADIDTPPTDDEEIIPGIDPRLTNAEALQLTSGNTLGLSISGDSIPVQHHAVINDSNGSPVLISSEAVESDRLFNEDRLNQLSLDFYRQGDATAEFVDLDVGGLGLISWGSWNATNTASGIEHYTSTGGNDPAFENDRLYWLTAEPDLNTTLTGTIAYQADSQTLNSPFLAGSSLGTITDISAIFNIDFDNATMVEGSGLTIAFDDISVDSNWDLILDDAVLNYNDNQFSLDIDANTPSEAFLGTGNGACIDCLQGSISGILVNQGDSIGSAFQLETTSDQSVQHQTEGLILLQKQIPSEEF